MRHYARDRLHRGLPQDSRWISVPIAVDDTAGRFGSRSADAGQAQRSGGYPRRMSVLAYQISGPGARGRIEMPSVRKCGVRPEVVVPACPDHPSILWPARGPAPDGVQRRVASADAGQIEVQVVVSEAFEMDVRIDQARPCPAAQPHHLGLAT